MNAVPDSLLTIKRSDLPAIGAELAGGYFTGVLNINGAEHALITAPKAAELEGIYGENKTIGTASYNDGLANTKIMAEAGSEIAKTVLAQTTGGFTDWALPARDQQELQYRAFKPGANDNSCTFRDGDNPSSVPPGYPYTEQDPAQTTADGFKAGEAEAFEKAYYLSSTEYAPSSVITAWGQDFLNGDQDDLYEDGEYYVRPVRSIPIVD